MAAEASRGLTTTTRLPQGEKGRRREEELGREAATANQPFSLK